MFNILSRVRSTHLVNRFIYMKNMCKYFLECLYIYIYIKKYIYYLLYSISFIYILPSLKRSMLHFSLVVVVETYLLVPKALQIFNARGDSLPFFKLNDRRKKLKNKIAKSLRVVFQKNIFLVKYLRTFFILCQYGAKL